MKKKYETSLFIFRRDLRLIDNTALNAALVQSEHVIACFIFDPAQVGNTNAYKSNNAIQCMLQSLQELHDELHKQKGKLYFFYGKTEDVIKKVIKNKKVDAIFCNRDYTPFSITRDNHIQKICADHAIAFESYGDALLNEPEDVTKKDKKPYFIFTPFYKRAATIPVSSCVPLHKGNWFTGNIPNGEPITIFKKILPEHNPNIAVAGGRNEALKILHHLKELKEYVHTHDYPSKITSHLSAHLKFGTISVRETYHAIAKELGTHHPLIRQLYWRDFFTHVAYHKPTIFGNAYREKYNKLPWNNNKKQFLAWCNGTTGFPIVDAGMRELNATGFMHNRVRMIVASFLVKDLHINWLWGEQYFAQQLVDYDPAVNNGNWQWCASTGCDAQPYFRIFNPWLQQKKFDPACIYIKKWIAELRSYDPKIIHSWFKKNSPLIKNYPKPMLDHAKESELAKRIYRKTS
ncbi:MAG TPA: deoxyribodipyrimidine photo-lyase [Candidatus Babeliales bacterium]|nr:deoxyribodipyrimidine photo-lyase [Candidatus Babeliales bacterium]